MIGQAKLKYLQRREFLVLVLVDLTRTFQTFIRCKQAATIVQMDILL